MRRDDGNISRQSAKTRRKIDEHTIGSRVASDASYSHSSRSHATSFDGRPSAHGSSRRHSVRGDKAPFIEQLGLHSTSGESEGAHSRRSTQRSYIEARQEHARRVRLITALVIGALTVAIAVAVGMFTYFKTTNANLDLAPSNAKEALVAPSEGEPFFVLCIADLSREGYVNDIPDAFGCMLVRVDEAARALTFITIPSRLDVLLSDGKYHALDKAYEVGGDAEIIRAVANVADVEISHFVSTDAEHLAAMVDLVGGYPITLPYEIDDPHAGSQVLPKGDVVLNGEQAIIYLRATNIPEGFTSTAAHRVDLTLYLISHALDSGGLDLASLVSDASHYISTDLGAADLLAMGEAARPMDTENIYQCIMPYYVDKDPETGGVLYEKASSQWNQIRERIDEGADPYTEQSDAALVDPATIRVEVRNGTNTTGYAARMSEVLSDLGYVITGIGNTDDGTTYPETLIVYTDPQYEGAARAIAASLGCGRAIDGGDFYSSEADVLAIVGLDWMPVE